VKATVSDLPYVATKLNKFYLGTRALYISHYHRSIFNSVVGLCMDFNINPVFWIEAQFFVVYYYVKPAPPRLNPMIFLGEAAARRYFMFLAHNEEYSGDPFVSEYQVLKDAKRKEFDIDVIYNNCIYPWIMLWIQFNSRKLATQRIVSDNPVFGEDFNPPFDVEIASQVIHELFPKPVDCNSWEDLVRAYQQFDKDEEANDKHERRAS